MKDLVLLLQKLVAPAQLPQLGVGVLASAATTLVLGRRGEAVLAVGDLQPAVQAVSEMPKSLAT